MFGKKKKKEEKMKDNKGAKNNMTTLIGEGSEIEGNIHSSSSARIEGKLVGTVKVGETLIVGSSGVINGDIVAKKVTVYGKVEGKIEAELLELKDKGRLNGDILVDTMEFEKGGFFNGNCKMKDSSNVTNINEADPESSFKTP